METPKEFLRLEINEGHLFIDSNMPPIILIGYLEKIKFDLLSDRIKFEYPDEQKDTTKVN